MDAVADYIMRLCCAALIAGAVMAIGGNGTGGKIRKIICGLFVMFVAISPLRQVRLDNFIQYPQQLQEQAEAAARDGESQAQDAVRDSIIEQTGAYILDEAASMNAQIEIGPITLDEETLQPLFVEIYGQLTPYRKKMLSDFISEQLGIGKEGQIWKN